MSTETGGKENDAAGPHEARRWKGLVPLARALYEAGVPHRVDVYAGDHRQQVRERLRTIVFPLVAAAIKR